jgi:hypothetical protein
VVQLEPSHEIIGTQRAGDRQVLGHRQRDDRHGSGRVVNDDEKLAVVTATPSGGRPPEDGRGRKTPDQPYSCKEKEASEPRPSRARP